ncbi:hypothetical protein MA16_Dca015339 [Dendrobium catenatum]|uniref:Uncharacterized protein n=1 Tax=Dendrobium catenatum TaxID=906689 RepID=A0A2I0W1D9_9ASPA|nr:hypothetical protein MA16_Dca015339 [Dendrobium catenatum]
MERSEPTFVPEWYKVSNSSAAGNGNSNHQSGFSLQSDEHNNGFSSRSRLTVSNLDYDAPRSLSFSGRTSSSSRRNSTSNGYIGHEKDISSRAYNSFGRSHRDRDRDRDREKDLEIHERDKSLLLDNGFGDYPDLLMYSKSEKDSIRRSQSMLSGRKADSWLKRAGHDSSNGVQSMGDRGRIIGITKSSFEREFPSLGAEEKHAGSDVIRVSSPGLSTAIDNLPVTSSTIIGADGWTSVLAEVPIVGSNLQTSSVLPPTASTTSTSLNMAETIAQTPARARMTPQVMNIWFQLPSDSQKIEELHRLQILKLRPVTPSMSKNSGVNLAEKSKTKGAKMVEYSTAKVGQQLPSQLVNHSFRSNIKPDVTKTSQLGNFHILNREKNGVSPIDKDNLHPRNGTRVAASPSGIPLAAIPYLNGKVYPKLNGKASALTSSSFGEKKLPSQAQNRNDFFNSLRKKSSSASCQENINRDPMYKEKLDEEPSVAVDAVSDKGKDASSLMPTLQCSEANGNCSGNLKVIEEPERLVPDEEEVAFLRSLGWEENAREDALTPEEIESFLTEVMLLY